MIKLPTELVSINESEADLIRPACEFFIRAVNESSFQMWAPQIRVYGATPPGMVYKNGKLHEVYKDRKLDDEFFAQMHTLSETFVADVPDHHQFRLDAFALAWVALGLRVHRQVNLGLPDPGMPQRASSLLDKLESYRRAARDAAIKKIGPQAYCELKARWDAFVDWTRCHIFVFQKRRVPNGLNMLKKDLLNLTHELALEVTLETVDQQELFKLIDKGRRDIRRGRQKITPMTMLKDRDGARQWVIDYIADHKHADWLKEEFWPEWYSWMRKVQRARKFMVRDDVEPAEIRPQRVFPSTPAELRAAQATPQQRHNSPLARPTTAAAPKPGAVSPSSISAGAATAAAVAKPNIPYLSAVFSEWFALQVADDYRVGVVNQIYREIPKTATTPAPNIPASEINFLMFKPADVGNSPADMFRFCVAWGLAWLCHVCREEAAKQQVVKQGHELAYQQWRHLSYNPVDTAEIFR